MGLCDHTHWWVACDYPGCNVSTHDDFDDPLAAEGAAISHGFTHTEEGEWFCDNHAPEKITLPSTPNSKKKVKESKPPGVG